MVIIVFQLIFFDSLCIARQHVAGCVLFTVKLHLIDWRFYLLEDKIDLQLIGSRQARFEDLQHII